MTQPLTPKELDALRVDIIDEYDTPGYRSIARLLATIDAERSKNERLQQTLKLLTRSDSVTMTTEYDAEPPACAKCRATDISVRWDKSYYDCLYREQQRRDWPHGDGEHLHYHCRTCGYSWASLVT